MDEGYFSHVPVLTASVNLSTGPVLELGAGFGSTLMLHGLCGAQKRTLVTLESDKDWLNKFTGYERKWHSIRYTDTFVNLPEYEMQWGLVFIDHGISIERGVSLKALKDAPIIVVHDSDWYWLYDYEPELSSFASRFDWKNGGQPQVTVVSNSVDVARIFSEFGL